MKTFKFVAIVVFLASIAFSNGVYAQKKWEVPAAEKSKVNPKAKNASVTELGKTEWNVSCKSCHGKLGLDDGPKGKMTEEFKSKSHVKLADNIKGQTDGELFYKIKTGNGKGMPSYGKKIKEETLWGLVNYMRTLQK